MTTVMLTSDETTLEFFLLQSGFLPRQLDGDGRAFMSLHGLCSISSI
nr:MAG TPA: hypothetical protein [Caudoviricetes sp.]